MGIERIYPQSSLLPPAVGLITVRIGVVNESDHLQASVEARSETDGQLLMLASFPHAGFADAERLLTWCTTELRQALADVMWTV